MSKSKPSRESAAIGNILDRYYGHGCRFDIHFKKPKWCGQVIRRRLGKAPPGVKKSQQDISVSINLPWIVSEKDYLARLVKVRINKTKDFLISDEWQQIIEKSNEHFKAIPSACKARFIGDWADTRVLINDLYVKHGLINVDLYTKHGIVEGVEDEAGDQVEKEPTTKAHRRMTLMYNWESDTASRSRSVRLVGFVDLVLVSTIILHSANKADSPILLLDADMCCFR
ncbi:hypothetical protein N431DRAFT_443026 [Stipitochalara longipes BDJ]|nr:hypothetical protein N431DRAFT_443026 [Stipitochalara longipes BDJ]